jgi:hypothetical protein
MNSTREQYQKAHSAIRQLNRQGHSLTSHQTYLRKMRGVSHTVIANARLSTEKYEQIYFTGWTSEQRESIFTESQFRLRLEESRVQSNLLFVVRSSHVME